MSAQRYVGPFAFAAAYHGFGDSDLTVAWLEKAFEARDAMVPLVKIHPGFEDLRSHPRFRALIESLRLPAP